MSENEILIFTDGSSRGNPGLGGYGWVAVYESHGTAKVEEGGGAEKETTNNRMELMAAIKAISYFSDYFVPGEIKGKSFKVISDSAYVINGITKWVFGWEKNSWRTSLKEDVLNKDLWQRLADAVKGKKIEWTQIKGHAGNSGNERCDEIATSFADSLNGGEAPQLFKGNLSEYNKDVLNVSVSAAAKSSTKGKKAYSYVSLVDGVVMTHKTWDECKARVSGQSGAKFKKTVNADDERDLIKSLGNL